MITEQLHFVFGTQGGLGALATPLQRLFNTLESGRVLRYHTAPSVTPQTNAQHQWGVLMIALFINGGEMSKNLYAECVAHDTGEYFGGDVPFTAKRDSAELKTLHDLIEDTARAKDLMIPPSKLSAQEKAVLKMADTLEGLIWCYKTEMRGPVFDRWVVSFRYGIRKFLPIITEQQSARATDIFTNVTGQTL